MTERKRKTDPGVKQFSLNELIIESIKDKKGECITHLDLSHLNTTISSAFLIAHANSSVQVKAIAEWVEERIGKTLGRKPYHREGYENAHWILLDYGEILVHIFQKNYRDFYDLEELWADGVRTDLTV